MDADLDTLATALYVKIDDLLKDAPQLAPWRPAVGIAPKLSDAELVTLAVHAGPARLHLRGPLAALRPRPPAAACSRTCPSSPATTSACAPPPTCSGRSSAVLASDTTLWSDDVWVVDSTPVECGRSRETVKRSDLAGWAEYGYCASHSRYFWGLRLHLVCTLHGLPVAFALTGAKADEREVLLDMLAADPSLVAARPGQTLIADKNYYGREFEATWPTWGSGCCARPARASPSGPARTCSSRCGRSSSRSTRPSRASSIWNATAATPRRGRRPGPATHPGPDRRDLAQRPHRPADR